MNSGTRQDDCSNLQQVQAIAREAGSLIMRVYESKLDIESKADGSPLTQADHASHAHILAHLQTLTPHIPILSEESVGITYEHRRPWKRFWLVDPLDGTKEFIKANGQFSVNIALIENGVPLLGVVYMPVSQTSYFACRSQGAYKQLGDDTPQRIQVRQYQAGKAVVVASRSHANERLDGFLQRLTEAEGEPELISLGSSLKLCMVAEGAADVYPRLGPTSEWDTAAAQCVVEEAGGQVLSERGQPLQYNKPSVLNPDFIVIGDSTYPWTKLMHEAA